VKSTANEFGTTSNAAAFAMVNSDPARCSNNAAGVDFNQRQLFDVTLDLDQQEEKEE